MKDRRKNQQKAGAIIRRHREALSLRQVDLADYANLSIRSLQRIENGENRDPRVTTLGKIIRQLAMSSRNANFVLRAWAGVE